MDALSEFLDSTKDICTPLDTPATEEETALQTAGDITSQELKDLILSTWIIDRFGTLMKFNPFPHQWQLINYILEKREKKLPIRLYLCKARQLGMSTLIQIIIFSLCHVLPGRKALVAAHKVEASQDVFDTCTVIYDHIPEDNRKPLLYRSLRGFAFAPPHYSRMRIETAKNLDLGRAGHLNYVHVTELPSWEKPKVALSALRPCVPMWNDTMIIYESTSKGPGDYFHSKYMAAKERRIDDEAMFIGPKDFPIYSLPPIKNQEDGFTETEIDFIREFDLSPEQAAWYVHTLRNTCDGDHRIFDLEYAFSDERAFAAWAGGWFDSRAIRLMMRKQHDDDPAAIGGMRRDPIFRGSLEWLNPNDPDDNLVRLVEDPRGALTIWKWVEQDRLYILASDWAEGLESDWHVIQVWALPRNPDERPEMVAKWKNCKMDSLKAAPFCEMLGYYYNVGLQAPERNHAGLTVVDYLKNVSYPNIYRDQGRVGQVKRKISSALGFRTPGGEKRSELSHAKKLIDGLEVIIHCFETLTEMQGFYWDAEKWDWAQSFINESTDKGNDDEVDTFRIFAAVYYRWGHRKWFTGFKTAEV